jgi:WD40 repeat protein
MRPVITPHHHTIPPPPPWQGEEFKSELIPISIHAARVNGVDVCLRKSVFATASDDRTIQMWGLNERRQEVKEHFDERVHCLSLHPSGGFLVAGFESSVRLMTIFVDNIKASWELAGVHCKLCKFSRGGQYFALVTDHGVTIYNTWTTRVFCQFKGLESNIKTLRWSPNDLKLVTCGTEGLVIVWNLVSRRKETLVSPPAGILIKDVFFTHDARAVLMACSDMSLKQMQDGNLEKEVFTDAVLRKITVSASGKLLVAGRAGRLLPLPLL